MSLTKVYTKTPVALDSLIKAISDSVNIIIALDSATTSLFGDQLTVGFKADLSDWSYVDAIVTAHDGVPLPQNDVTSVSIAEDLSVLKTSTLIPKVSIYDPEGDAATIGTHDFSKKQTWYQNSVLVSGEVLTTTDNLVFSSVHTFWIDLTHSLMYDEDVINSTGTYTPVIKIDDVVQTSGFTINYSTGGVTFSSSVSGVVTANYYYATTSYFAVKPKTGKVLAIKAAEVQFTTDVVINDSFVFEAWFKSHPTYGTMAIPGTRIAYKSPKDFMTACNEGQGLIPAWGGMVNDTHVFPFKYARPKPVKYSQYIEIRVYLLTHQPITGEYATGTFYVTIDIE